MYTLIPKVLIWKVVISYPNDNVIVETNIDSDSKAVIRNIALKQWKAAVNKTYRHKLLSSELFLKLENEVEKEMWYLITANQIAFWKIRSLINLQFFQAILIEESASSIWSCGILRSDQTTKTETFCLYNISTA